MHWKAFDVYGKISLRFVDLDLNAVNLSPDPDVDALWCRSGERRNRVSSNSAGPRLCPGDGVPNEIFLKKTIGSDSACIWLVLFFAKRMPLFSISNIISPKTANIFI